MHKIDMCVLLGIKRILPGNTKTVIQHMLISLSNVIVPY